MTGFCKQIFVLCKLNNFPQIAGKFGCTVNGLPDIDIVFRFPESGIHPMVRYGAISYAGRSVSPPEGRYNWFGVTKVIYDLDCPFNFPKCLE